MRKSIIYMGCLLILGVSLVTSCAKKDNTDNTTDTDLVTITPEVTPSIVPDEEEPNITPTEPIIEEPTYIGEKEATKLIDDEILERGYFVQYSKEITIDDKEYYEFNILSGDATMKPNVIVDKITGEILCLNEDNTTSPLNTHPIITIVDDGKDEEKEDITEESTFSPDDAYKKLSKLSKEILKLPLDISEYTIVYDDWNTFVNGQECYGINALSKVDDKMISMGVFYVAVDGSAMYQFDFEADDFVEIN